LSGVIVHDSKSGSDECVREKPKRIVRKIRAEQDRCVKSPDGKREPSGPFAGDGLLRITRRTQGVCKKRRAFSELSEEEGSGFRLVFSSPSRARVFSHSPRTLPNEPLTLPALLYA
jgi:hypothetical protein